MFASRTGRAKSHSSPTFGGINQWNDARRPLHCPFEVRRPTADHDGPPTLKQGGFGVLEQPLGLVNPTPNTEGCGPCMAV